MRILLTGATGFIGSALAAALRREGHIVRGVSRQCQIAACDEAVALDMTQAVRDQDWTAAVQGIDVVVNAAGILRETRSQRFEALHYQAPAALFRAAVAAGVVRIVQVSALGADDHAAVPYHLSKRAADTMLRTLPVPGTILYPSLVYGPGGRSAAFFDMGASLPCIPVPGDGEQAVQPVHLDDLIACVIALLRLPASDMPSQLDVVGPQAMTLRAYYQALRRAQGERRPARILPVPMPLVRMLARTGDRLPGMLLDTDTLAMLTRGNTGDATGITALLGRSPRPVSAFVDPAYAEAVRMTARLRWLAPVLRISVALVWLVTAIVSAGLYPVEDSLALLAQAGVPAPMQWLALYGAAGLDLLFGIAVLWPRRRPWWWVAQAGLVLGYTAIITLKLPEFWLHPYGPVLKNLPFLAVLWLMYELERR